MAGFVDDSHAAHRPGHPHIAWRRQSSVPDHWYLYFADAEWGPAFVKLCSYAPYPLWCCANGHEWAKRQLAQGRRRLHRARQRAARRSTTRRAATDLRPARRGHVRDLLRRMMAVMPDPLTHEDRRAGFDWSFSIAQLEVSDTAVFDQPRRARAWFEAAIGAHLDLGRPERVSLVVNRTIVNRGKNKTPGRFATEVITRDVAPAAADPLQVLQSEGLPERGPGAAGGDDDQQRHRLRRAQDPQRRELARVATCRRPPRPVPGCPRRGTTRPARPRHPRSRSCCPPSTTANVLPACASVTRARWPCSASVAAFTHVIGGLTNKPLRAQMAVLWNPDYTSAQASYDLRRLRLKGSSNASTTPTPTGSPPTGCASPPSSPSSPPVSSSPPSPTSPRSHDHTPSPPRRPHRRVAQLRTRTHALLRQPASSA